MINSKSSRIPTQDLRILNDSKNNSNRLSTFRCNTWRWMGEWAIKLIFLVKGWIKGSACTRPVMMSLWQYSWKLFIAQRHAVVDSTRSQRDICIINKKRNFATQFQCQSYKRMCRDSRSAQRKRKKITYATAPASETCTSKSVLEVLRIFENHSLSGLCPYCMPPF